MLFRSVPKEFFPLVVKGFNQNVIHKSDINAVKINIKDRTELEDAAKNIHDNFVNNGFNVEHFLIQKYLDIKFELLIGGYCDASFGPIIMFGSGGKYVEILDDTAIRSAYLTDEDIRDMIAETKIGKLLHGVRGEAASDINTIAAIIKSCSQMMLENPGIQEFDINPLVVTNTDEIFIVDIRVKAGENN